MAAGLEDPAIQKSLYLSVAVEGSVMQRSAPATVRHVDAAQQRDDHLGTAQSVVGCSDVQRRLPVLVPGVHVGRVVNQDSDRLLRNKTRLGGVCDPTVLISACPTSGTLGPERNIHIEIHRSSGIWIITLINCT